MLDWFLDRFGENALFVVVGIIFVLVLIGLFYGAKAEQTAWNQYAESHHCEVKGIKRGQSVLVLGGKGGVVMSPDQTIYVCDGGEIVIR